jgi:hypothetical protein
VARSATSGDQGCGRQQERDHEVELLLDRQGPVVLERRGCVIRGEVVGLDRGEPDVRTEARGPDGILGHLLRTEEREAVEGHSRRRQEHHRGRGDDPPGAAGVERDDGDPIGLLGLAHQQANDEEAGDDEEDIDTDESTREPAEPGMSCDHEEDGDRSQTLDIAAKVRSLPQRPSPLTTPPTRYRGFTLGGLL